MASCVAEDEKSVFGKYVAATPCGNSTLTLRSDHSFIQEEHANNIFRKRSGQWRLSHQWVIFKVDVDDATDRTSFIPIPGAARVERLPKGFTMGPLIINCPDSAHEFDYVKPWLG